MSWVPRTQGFVGSGFSAYLCIYICVHLYTYTHTHTYLNTHIYIVQNKKCFIEHTVLMLKIWALLPELDSSSGLDKGNPNTAEPWMGKEPVWYLMDHSFFPLPPIRSMFLYCDLAVLAYLHSSQMSRLESETAPFSADTSNHPLLEKLGPSCGRSGEDSASAWCQRFGD